MMSIKVPMLVGDLLFMAREPPYASTSASPEASVEGSLTAPVRYPRLNVSGS